MIHDTLRAMARQQADGRFVRVPDAAWEEVLRLARELGCVRGSEASVGIMLTEIGEGALAVRRVRARGPMSLTERVRRQIDLDPTAKNQAIAAQLGLQAHQVAKIRSVYKKAREAGEA